MTEMFEGYEGRECGDHRAVASGRAWCFVDSEWCYPDDLDMACRGCALPSLRQRITAQEDIIRELVAVLEMAEAIAESDSDAEGVVAAGRALGELGVVDVPALLDRARHALNSSDAEGR